jgi:hypothetical protein
MCNLFTILSIKDFERKNTVVLKMIKLIKADEGKVPWLKGNLSFFKYTKFGFVEAII